MFETIDISELQKTLSRVLNSTKGFLYILSNNKKKGLIIGEDLMKYMEEEGILEEYEDAMLLEKCKKERVEAHKKILSGDSSDFLTFDELCQ